MKFAASALIATVVSTMIAVGVEARLYHFPLGQADEKNVHERHLQQGDVDLDALYQARGIQYAQLKVGTPQQRQSAIISTASHAIGFPCLGCQDNCGEGSHLDAFFLTNQSSTYKDIVCPDCKLREQQVCDSKSRQCPVNMYYAEGSSWSGIEVEDMISVGGEDADDEAYRLRFGCQLDVDGLFEGQIPDGIFGMNKQKGSAIKQWTDMKFLDASAFSLCYNIREDVKKKSGVMVLGGPDTRLHEKEMVFAKDVGNDNYKVKIVSIHLQKGRGASTGNTTSHAKAQTDLTVPGLDGTDTAMVDSGTTCTYLHRKLHEPLQDAWEQLTNGKYPMFRHLDISSKDLDKLPTIIFELKGEKDGETIMVAYPPIRYLEKNEVSGWDFCLYASDSASMVTLGNTFMSGHDVLHDLDNKRIGFAESKCLITLVETVTTDADAPKTKAFVTHAEPHHAGGKRSRPPRSLGWLYGILIVGALATGAVLYRRKRKAATRALEEDGSGFKTDVKVEMT